MYAIRSYYAAVISTPYWHAEELLAEGRGCLFDFGNHRQLAEVANRLLNDADELNAIRKNAYEFGLTLSWPKMGGKYLDLFDKIKVATLHIPVQPRITSYTVCYTKLLRMK